MRFQPLSPPSSVTVTCGAARRDRALHERAASRPSRRQGGPAPAPSTTDAQGPEAGEFVREGGSEPPACCFVAARVGGSSGALGAPRRGRALRRGARAFWRSSAAAASRRLLLLPGPQLLECGSLLRSLLAASAAASGGQLRRAGAPGEDRRPPLGRLGETVATAARSRRTPSRSRWTPRRSRLRRRERISRTRPTSPARLASRVLTGAVVGRAAASARARARASSRASPDALAFFLARSFNLARPSSRSPSPRAVVVRRDCNSGRVASERARVGGDELVSETCAATNAPLSRGPSARSSGP